MNNNYFRITGYYPKDNFCFIVDSNGMFEKLWQFSSFLVTHDIEVIQVNKLDDILDINIKPVEFDGNNILLRAIKDGKPEQVEQVVNGITYKAIKVADKIYIPDITQTI